MQKMQQALQQLQQENQMLKAGDQTDRMKIQADHQEAMAKLQQDERFRQLEADIENRKLNIEAAALKVEAMLGQMKVMQGEMALKEKAVETALGNQLEAARLQLEDQGKTADRALKAAEKTPVVRPKRRSSPTRTAAWCASAEDDPATAPGLHRRAGDRQGDLHDDEGNIKAIEDA
jgi:hypothetical protein